MQGPNFRRDWHFKPIGRIRVSRFDRGGGPSLASGELQGGLGCGQLTKSSREELFRRSRGGGFLFGIYLPTPVAFLASMLRPEMSDIRKSPQIPGAGKGLFFTHALG